jgi:hypothetical protein
MPILNPASLETSAISYYPMNAQLFFAWLMLPLRNAFISDLGEVPFYIIGIITVYSILRRYSVNVKIALLSGFLWVLIPNIFKQLRTSSQIDVICAVLFLLMFYTLLLLKENFNLKNTALFGISTGLFIGTKIINFAWLAGFLPIMCYILYRELRKNRFVFSRVLSFIGTIALMIVLFGGFMYIKNYLFTGNPLFPVDLRIFGKTIFKGILDNAAYKIQIALGDKLDLNRLIFKEGLGFQFLALILPGMFLPLLSFGYLKKKVKPWGEYLLLFATPVMMFIAYDYFIDIYVVRYLFPLLSMGLITAIIFINLLPHGERYIIPVSFISIIASALELAHRHELIVSLLFSFTLFAILVIYKKQIAGFYKSKAFFKAMLALLLALLLSFIYLNKKYDEEEFSRYYLSFSKKEAWQIDIAGGWQKLNEVTGRGSRIAHTGRQEFFQLFGTGLKNDVKYISVNAQEVSPYKSLDGLCRKTKDFSAWRENLRKEKIEYLFVAQPFFDNRESIDPASFPVEDEWAAAHPDDFQLLFSNSKCRIYKVLIKEGQLF